MSKEATQEESGVKQSCFCVQRMNDALRETYPGARLLVDINSGRPIIATYRVAGKKFGKTPTVLPTFCPFCGVKYGN